ncbi:MAG: 3-aminobutyryl-CoA ammonia lyase [Deltaproteobacteria bacterium]|nr:3-aminobutyryl-CoA ammonia lyase [Deltaproteobacteria bacterium]
MAKDKVVYKARMSQADAHYGGGLVDGARMMQLFGEAATELLIRLDGDEGLFRAYESVDFLAPVYAGDFIEVEASLLKQGHTSRKIEFMAFKIIESSKDPKNPSRAKTLNKPILVAKAVGTCVVKK